MKTFLTILILLCFIKGFSQNYHLEKRISLPGDEGWDYLAVDNAAQHLFVSHGSCVNVVDLLTDKPIAVIPDTKGVHGIALANDLKKAFISNGKENTVSVINSDTFQLIEKISLKSIKPDAILYDGFSHQVFVYNAKSNDATVIDANTDKVIKTIPLGGKPEFSVTNGKGLVYVNIEDRNEVKVIDTKTLDVIHTWSIAPGEEPSGLAIDTDTNRLFSVCGNKLMVVLDAVNGKIIQTLPIGDGCDGVVFDPARKLAFSSNGEGTITVVKEEGENSFTVLETVRTQKSARTIALNQTTHQLYLSAADFGPAPQPTPENPKPRPSLIPGSFVVLVLGNNSK